ncbi:hypothetical protein [Amycolatopsis orientalis]|uniref:hypothetical protein n=1 Tax=Amycolatopsis orientalis TaxID=31958 RepID=UPI00041F96D6|nr:hypothetical protein [Amycolatopsis orientalis]
MPDDELQLHDSAEPSDDLGIPVIVEVVALATHLIKRGVALTTDQLAVAPYRVPGDDMPVLLNALHRHRLITDHTLSDFVGLAWSHAERPDLALSRGRWRTLFTAAGGFGNRLPGAIWTALVEPERLQARNTDRDEAEYVVDTSGLTIDPVAGGHVLADTAP